MSRKDGGPAFPESDTGYGGMSLRDYFAAKTMPAIYEAYATDADVRGWDLDWKGGIAREAYDIADAMLKARELQP